MADRLESIVLQVKAELDSRYQREDTYRLIVRLRKLVNQLNYSTYKNSVAIYLSEKLERVFYLGIEVEDRFSVDGPVSMRDLVQSKKDTQKYLLLLLSADRANVFEGEGRSLNRIMGITPESMGSYQHELPERVANFSDPASIKETLMEKFFRYVDHSLSLLLVSYPYPVILLAAERTAGHFKKISNNTSHLAAYLHGNYDDATESGLQELIAPLLQRWKNLRQQHLLAKLEKAMDAGRLSTGLRDVCREASLLKGQLLVLEEGRNYNNKTNDAPFYVQDKVDEAIIKVLESGGDVEFAAPGMLGPYQHIALVKYY